MKMNELNQRDIQSIKPADLSRSDNAMKICNSHLFLMLRQKAKREARLQQIALDKVIAKNEKATQYLDCDKIGK